jgi:IS30 family transposase
MPDQNEETKDFILIPPDNQPELNNDLQKSIGEALNKMFDPNLAIMTGELTDKERICLTALYIRSQKLYKKGELDNRYSQYIKDYMIRTVPRKRARAGEAVNILQNLVTYINRSKEGLKGKLGL